MTQYLPIKTLSEQTGWHEKTIRRLVREHGLAHYRLSGRGKILVKVEDFERYTATTRREVNENPVVVEILREFAQAVR